MSLKKSVLIVLFLLALLPICAADLQTGALAFVIFKLGNHYFNLNDFDRAEALYHKAIQIDEGFSPAYYNLGVVSYAREDFESAEKWFGKAIEVDDNNARAEYSLGLLMFELKNFAGAAEHFRNTVGLQPENENAHFDLGVSLVEGYRSGTEDITLLEEALKHFEHATGKVQYAEQNAAVLRKLI